MKKTTNPQNQKANVINICRRAALLVTVAIVAAGSFALISAQSAIAETDSSFRPPVVSYQFGQTISITAGITSDTQAKEIIVNFQPEGKAVRTETVIPAKDGSFTYTIDLTAHPLSPFTSVEFWFRASLNDGTVIESDHSSFLYEDNRFVWQTLENNRFQVHWYSGDQKFGQEALNAAESGLHNAVTYLPVAPNLPVKIYVYASAYDLQEAMNLSQQPWVAGRATPELGITLVSIPDGPVQRLEMERQIPHELMHILEYEFMGSVGYNKIPTWLSEGLASLAELNPNSDYERVLNQATTANALIPMTDLCVSFPTDTDKAFLSYAQSASFTRFLFQKSGSPAIQALLTQYMNGMGCEEGVQSIYGSSLSQLEYSWRQEALGVNAKNQAWQNLLPYITIGLVILLIPFCAGLIYFRQARKKAAEAKK